MKKSKVTKSGFSSETELCKVVETWATYHGWDVFKEVNTDGGDIDLVLTQGRIIWAIETKTRLNCEVLEQAYNRLNFAHIVSVATPNTKKWTSFVFTDFMRRYGIGHISVYYPEGYRSENPSYLCKEEVVPRFVRPHDMSPRHLKKPKDRAKRISKLRNFLSDKHKTLIAGAPGGGQWTPWKATVEKVKNYLAKVNEASIKDIAENVDHHYRKTAHARAGIHRLFTDIEPDLFEKTENGLWRLKP